MINLIYTLRIGPVFGIFLVLDSHLFLSSIKFLKKLDILANIYISTLYIFYVLIIKFNNICYYLVFNSNYNILKKLIFIIFNIIKLYIIK